MYIMFDKHIQARAMELKYDYLFVVMMYRYNSKLQIRL